MRAASPALQARACGRSSAVRHWASPPWRRIRWGSWGRSLPWPGPAGWAAGSGRSPRGCPLRVSCLRWCSDSAGTRSPGSATRASSGTRWWTTTCSTRRGCASSRTRTCRCRPSSSSPPAPSGPFRGSCRPPSCSGRSRGGARGGTPTRCPGWRSPCGWPAPSPSSWPCPSGCLTTGCRPIPPSRSWRSGGGASGRPESGGPSGSIWGSSRS